MKKNYGIIAAFDSTPDVFHACEQVRDAGYTLWDTLTPFPVHGLDAAMGMRRSKLPRFSLAGGITGFCTGMSFIAWLGLSEYPLVVGGKPMFSPMFAFPVSYELTILFTAFASIGGMFFLNRLPMHYHPVIKAPGFVRAMDDRFYIVIESADPKFNAAETRALLERAGGKDIVEIEE